MGISLFRSIAFHENRPKGGMVAPKHTFWNTKQNIAAARAVDREFNDNFGSNLGLWGSGRGFNGRGAPVGFIWAEFQLKRSHGELFRAPNHGLVRPVLPWY